ncbi:DUF4190 domain-containing protein [Actinomyces vulturis]|uniref:DUF4190 domain-containing protein n=1 Tax=Actinomyces vulturis TaxID=1857645 RepID=UPI000830BF82|nr:DUF4190 domain-containing protein [Actinomyces vulturis]
MTNPPPTHFTANPQGDSTRLVPEGFVFPGTETINPAEVFSTPGYQAPKSGVPVLARLALIFGIVSVLMWPLGIVALVLGIIAYIRRTPHHGAEQTSALAGMVIGAMTTVIFVWTFILVKFSFPLLSLLG